ncbi:MAG: sn-glycerol-3-phosphate ABC transporter ATP-binding protein UgpC [Mesorhizobium sp.]|nr:sn-glycerol-3-phosphate ABC transporter ATP-binding protein UgpC [Mesorhizobium sp.]MBL8579094.1 sn-glycerol-3-phosphate ABC transporter ATP-binding protein UgpC [Mesorhizobium sp.]
MTAAITIKSLRKTFGALTVLHEVDLSIEPGQFVVLVGPSGCGKSTLLDCICGLSQPTAGSLHFDDQDVTNLPPRERDIAMVFQSYALYPSMTVRQNIEFGLKVRKMPKAERDKEVTRVATLLKIEHLLDRRPSQMSGGQRQRVAMGRAMARRPRIFLFDEPLSNLDAKLRVEMRHEIKRMHQLVRTTTIYVTHDQVEALSLADVIVVMKEGHIQQVGTPQEIYDKPANTFVASFMGSPPMNLIPARMKRRDGVAGAELLPAGGLPNWIKLQEPAKPIADGEELIIGIRPEEFHFTSERPLLDGDVAELTLPINVLEPLGSEYVFTSTVNGAEVSARLNAKSGPHPDGDTLQVLFEPRRVCLFDPGTSNRL